jgi:hypothetical protein
MIPRALKTFFWDVSIETVDPSRNKGYVISRILELGDETAVTWLTNEYSEDDLRETIQTSRLLSARSRNYWKIKYSIA